MDALVYGGHRPSSILISRFILNLRQVDHNLVQQSDTSFSLDVQFATQTRSSRSLPRSLEPFVQPVHVNVEEEEGYMEGIPATKMDLGYNQESVVVSEPEVEG